MEKQQSLSDELLVGQIRAGNSDLYRHIVNRYQAKLFRYVNYLLHHESQSADVVQETFIKAYINLNSFNPAKKFSSWIYRIAHNEAMNAVKKYRREVPLLENPRLFSPEDPVKEISRQEIVQTVKKCLSRLPVAYSEPLSLFFLEDKSYEEISDILRLPIGTVGTRINRAKLLMKRLCQNNLI